MSVEFERKTNIRQAINRGVDSVTRCYSEESMKEYKRATTRGGSVRTGNRYIKLGINASLNEDDKEVPQYVDGDFHNSIKSIPAGNLSYKTGHFGDNYKKLLTLIKGSNKKNFARRKALPYFAADRKQIARTNQICVRKLGL